MPASNSGVVLLAPCGNSTRRLRVWWIPQVPMEAFMVEVSTLVQAKTLLAALAQYDLFQLAHNLKPDFCNAGGLTCFESGEWLDWETAAGDSIDTLDMDQCFMIDAMEVYNAE